MKFLFSCSNSGSSCANSRTCDCVDQNPSSLCIFIGILFYFSLQLIGAMKNYSGCLLWFRMILYPT